MTSGRLVVTYWKNRRRQVGAAAARASAADRKAAEREAARLHVESRLAEVESMNANLAGDLADIDGLLSWALEMDYYVDLESLKISEVEHPPFAPGRLAVPAPAVPRPDYAPAPVYEGPPAPGKLSAMLGGNKRHQQAVEEARTAYADAHDHWEFTEEPTAPEYFQSRGRWPQQS